MFFFQKNSNKNQQWGVKKIVVKKLKFFYFENPQKAF